MGRQSIQYVTGGLTLVAFVVAAIFYYFAARLRNRAEIIKSAPAKDRLEAISVLAEEFRVDLSDLSDRRKAEIILRQIEIRARREIMFALVGTVIAVMLFVIAIIAMLQQA